MSTTIQLTEQQRQAVEAQQGRPVEVVDPVTNRVYVLVTAESYQRVRGLLDQPAPAGPPARIAPLMLRSMQAYWRDLPELLRLKSQGRRWVAYHGDERVGFGQTDVEVYQECLRRGLYRGEFYVGELEPDPEGVPPWGTVESDWSLYEAAEGDDATPPPSRA